MMRTTAVAGIAALAALVGCDRRSDTEAGGPTTSAVVRAPESGAAPAQIEKPTPRPEPLNPDVPVSGDWQGRLTCNLSESISAESVGQSGGPRLNQSTKDHGFLLTCDESGKPTSITLVGYGQLRDRVIDLGEPGSSQVIEDQLQQGALEYTVTVDRLEYTKDSVEIALSGVVAIEGPTLQQNGVCSQTLKASVVDGKLKLDLSVDYQLTLTVAVLEIPSTINLHCDQAIGRKR